MNSYERMIGQAAIRTFGRIPNIIKAVEELAELQQALCKHIVSEHDAMTVESVHEEIADVLSIEVGTVKSRLARGRELLRDYLLSRDVPANCTFERR